MSTAVNPSDSPLGTPIQPLHNPSQAAHVVVPQAPLGNVANTAPSMGTKALLAKKMAKNHNPNFVSPTDNLMTPCTQKLNAAKKKHFSKSAKPVQLFAQNEQGESSGDDVTKLVSCTTGDKITDDDENPF
ncbi:hypothetical protein AX17_001004 [Amanita inopinata Kibby_2008]|nr:hypothetical protein AX17_001004 [Amanita inopinata Kibby_2008]